VKQKCPKCNGSGGYTKISPRNVFGMIFIRCYMCQGKGILYQDKKGGKR